LQQNCAYAYSEKATKRDITTTNYQQLFDTANKQTYKTSVATLLLRKNTSFHYKKNTRFTKSKLHTVNMPRKCVAMPTIDIVRLIVNQR